MSQTARIVTYANTSGRCFCQLKLASGERIFISIASQPTPSTKVIKLKMGGFVPGPTIWEYNATMAGGYEAYVENLMIMFAGEMLADPDKPQHPLDAMCEVLSHCSSIDEVRHELLDRERLIHV
jgi:hypothetical protein